MKKILVYVKKIIIIGIILLISRAGDGQVYAEVRGGSTASALYRYGHIIADTSIASYEGSGSPLVRAPLPGAHATVTWPAGSLPPVRWYRSTIVYEPRLTTVNRWSGNTPPALRGREVVTWEIPVRPDVTGIKIGQQAHGIDTIDDSYWFPPGNTHLTIVFSFPVPSDRAIMLVQIYSDGDLILSTVHRSTSYGALFDLFSTSLRWYDPKLLYANDLEKVLGDPVMGWDEEILATWGYTTANLIPDKGAITDFEFNGTTVPALSSNRFNYDQLGHHLRKYIIQDDHALDNTGVNMTDNTKTEAMRYITVRTPVAPNLLIRYSATAVDKDNNQIGNIIYTDSGLTLSGGEEGWTNQPLDISVSSGGIPGIYDMVLKMAGESDLAVAAPASATKTDYQSESLTSAGQAIVGVLTAKDDIDIELSPEVYGNIKIDTTNPVPNATHNGGYSFTDTSDDALSGRSVLNPSKIAFVVAGSGTPPADTSYMLFSDVSDVTVPAGMYDIWVWATDKAGNERKMKIDTLDGTELIASNVEISKDTDVGAVLHIAACGNAGSISIESGCETDCTDAGATVDVLEDTELTYEITIKNTNTTNNANGTFLDYLPIGIAYDSFSYTTSASGTINIPTPLIETLPPYDGQYKVEGTYTLEPGEEMVISLTCKVESLDEDTGTNIIISNQASTQWTLGTGAGARTGNSDSNYANHRVTELAKVATLFTKVGADDLITGLPNVEFLLYKWNETEAEYIAGNHDTDILGHSTLTEGDWIRVKKGGKVATELTDIFTSDSTGKVDLGRLPSGIYTLIETKSVAGYEIPIGQWILTIDPTKGDNGVGDWKIEFVGKSDSIMPPAVIRDTGGLEPTYRIINARPFSIGVAGLGGTRGLLLAGFVLMALAGNAYIVYSYKQREKNK